MRDGQLGVGASEDCGIRSAPATDDVVAGTAIDGVVPVIARKDIVAGSAIQRVFAISC